MHLVGPMVGVVVVARAVIALAILPMGFLHPAMLVGLVAS